jgi:hypothetical protein
MLTPHQIIKIKGREKKGKVMGFKDKKVRVEYPYKGAFGINFEQNSKIILVAENQIIP